MAILAWGKCAIYMKESENGAPKVSGSWTMLPTPKNGTTSMEVAEGDVTEAQEEGGDVVDRYVGAAKPTFTFQLFQKKGESCPIEHHDGRVAGEWSFRLVPEDDTITGRQFDRCRVSVVDSFTSADGFLFTVNVTPLKPASGDIVKEYTENSGVTGTIYGGGASSDSATIAVADFVSAGTANAGTKAITFTIDDQNIVAVLCPTELTLTSCVKQGEIQDDITTEMLASVATVTYNDTSMKMYQYKYLTGLLDDATFVCAFN